jgi:hypothetical protein
MHQETETLELPPAELARAKAQGWELKDTTDESGVHRQYFVGRKAGREVLQGMAVSWFPDGKPRKQSQYRDGKLYGPYREWRQSGGLRRTGVYQESLADGPWTYFHPGGQKAAEGRYRGGLPEGPWVLQPPGGSVRRPVFHEGVAAPFRAERHRGMPPPLAGSLAQWDVRVDPRLELLAVVQSFTEWPTIGPWATPDEPYVRAVAAWFQPYKDHPAIKKYIEILNGGTNFAFDGPPSVILHFSDPPALKPLAPVRSDLLKRAGGAAQLDTLISLLRDFVRDSRFTAFFAAQQPLYRQLTADYGRVFPGQRALQLLQNHYGEARSAFTVAISPLIGGANYGPQIDEPGGSRIYNIGSPAFSAGSYTFSVDWVRPMIFHEFGHSFANAAVDACPALLAYGEKLYPPVENRMRALAYGNWQTTLYELFVRTNEIRLLELFGARKEAKAMLATYLDEGFLWLPYTLSKLKEYEANRSKYRRFRDFLPQMESFFQTTEFFFAGDEALFVVPR